ncbi:MAG TPA: LytTR family DNA-binding domain-containing protein [Thermoanaerobaculia bacterium]
MPPIAEWKVVVADDEPAARRGVRQLLARFPRFAVVAECRNGAEVLAALAADPADVLFLDVQMPGMDGFEVLGRCPAERTPLTVFLTAHDDHALRAFEAAAVDYLLKPVAEARFTATLGRLERQLAGRPRPVAPRLRFAVATPRETLFVEPDQIDWIAAAGNYVKLWVGPRGHLVRDSLDRLEGELRRHGFVRVHRGALVQRARVRSLLDDAGTGLSALLVSGARVPVSRRRRAGVVAALRGDPAGRGAGT